MTIYWGIFIDRPLNPQKLMIAFRQFLTLSTSSAVLFGSGGLAIAQDLPTVSGPQQEAAFLNNVGVLAAAPTLERKIPAEDASPQANHLSDVITAPDKTLTVISDATLAPNFQAPQAPLLASQGVISQPKVIQKAEVATLPTAIDLEVVPLNSIGSLTAIQGKQALASAPIAATELSVEVASTPVISSETNATPTAIAPQQKSFIFEQTFSTENSSETLLTQRERGIPVIETETEITVDEESDGSEVVETETTTTITVEDDETVETTTETTVTVDEESGDGEIVETETTVTVDTDIDETETEIEVETGTETEVEANPIPLISETTAIPPGLRLNTELQSLLVPVENRLVSVPLLTGEVRADQEVPLTLEETIALALENNETLREAQLNVDRTEFQLREAIAAEYPTVTNQTTLSRADTTSGELQAEAIGRDDSDATSSLSSRLEVSYDVYTGGRRSNQIDAAETQLRITELEVDRITEETRLNAATTYYDLQGADSQAAIEESAIDNANQSLRDAQLLENAGLGTKFDVLRAQVELANAEQRLTRAYANQRTIRRRLAQLLSLDPNLDPRTADEIAIAGQWGLTLEESILLALQQREELRQQLLQREIDGYQKQIALANIRPQVSVFANYDLLEVFDDDLSVADGFSLGARMQWNIFDGGAAAARADQEDVDQAIAENRFIDQRNQIRLAVETAYYDYAANRRNIETATLAVSLAEESLRLARIRFTAGVGTQTDVIAAQTELTTAQNNLLQTVTDYNRAYAQLKREVSVGEELESAGL
ncbi:MAG: TolC family protein [Limnothrix sp.]